MRVSRRFVEQWDSFEYYLWPNSCRLSDAVDSHLRRAVAAANDRAGCGSSLPDVGFWFAAATNHVRHESMASPSKRQRMQALQLPDVEEDVNVAGVHAILWTAESSRLVSIGGSQVSVFNLTVTDGTGVSWLGSC